MILEEIANLKSYIIGYDSLLNLIEKFRGYPQTQANKKILAEYIERSTELEIKITTLIAAIEKIENPMVRIIARDFYITGLSTQEIAERFTYSRRSIERYLIKAREELEKIEV